MNAGKTVLCRQSARFELFEEFRNPFEESKLFAETFEGVIAHTVDAESVEQLFEVAQLAIPSLIVTALIALFPEQLGVDAELRKDGVLLHVVRTESLVKIEDKRDGILRN